MAIAKEVGDRAGEGRAYANLGVCHMHLGEYVKAVVYNEARGGKRATTLSLQDTVQLAGSVHLAEKLCPFSPLNPKSISWRARGQE